MERAYEKTVGTVLVALGVGILLFGFVTAYDELHGLPSNKAPTAKFSWAESGFSVTFTDESSGSGASISTVYWSFGDGSSSSSASPSHTYSGNGPFNVTLQIQDENGASAQSTAELALGPTTTASGSSSPSGPVGNGTNTNSVLGSLFGGLSGVEHTAQTFALLLVVWLIGGAILRGGWNLVTPKAETISVRVRPRSLQVEPAVPAPSPPAPAPAAPAAGDSSEASRT